MEEQLVDDPGATSFGLFLLADEFLEAARATSRTPPRLSSGPTRLLCFHACELFLKAYLRKKDHSHASLRGLMHNLSEMADRSSEVGLDLGKEISNALKIVTEINAYVDARYYVGRDAGPFSSTAAVIRLTEEVRERVRRALNLNNLGMPL